MYVIPVQKFNLKTISERVQLKLPDLFINLFRYEPHKSMDNH
jgi:hypothetical protein